MKSPICLLKSRLTHLKERLEVVNWLNVLFELVMVEEDLYDECTNIY